MTERSLHQVHEMGPPQPFVLVERLRDISREDGYKQNLDSHGDSEDGHVICYHAVSRKHFSFYPCRAWFWFFYGKYV